MSAWEAFHFIRPGALLLLLPAALIIVAMLHRSDPLRGWKKIIAPDLLTHLAVKNDGRQAKLSPVLLLAAGWLLGITAVAGPAWEKEPTPFTEDRAALFIVMKVAPSMLAQDIQPSRLQRSAQKVGDLLALRPGSKTALIAYAGSAHLVMPLTSDPEIIRYFAAQLSPEVMPQEGDDPVAAVELAQRRLAASGLAGSIVLLTDAIDLPFTPAGAADVHILAMAAGPGVVPPPGSPPAPARDESALREAARAAGGQLVLVTPDDSDVRQLNGRIERSIAAAPAQQGDRWKEAGYALMFGVMMIILPLFRRGGAMRLES